MDRNQNVKRILATQANVRRPNAARLAIPFAEGIFAPPNSPHPTARL